MYEKDLFTNCSSSQKLVRVFRGDIPRVMPSCVLDLCTSLCVQQEEKREKDLKEKEKKKEEKEGKKVKVKDKEKKKSKHGRMDLKPAPPPTSEHFLPQVFFVFCFWYFISLSFPPGQSGLGSF